jgi:hypothetical protein
MAHFAQIDQYNNVVNVVVVDNKDCLDGDGNESEIIGASFLKQVFGPDTNWVQTSYNASFRYNYAGIGDIWDPDADAFYQPQPHDSWTLNEEFLWEAPEPYPSDGELYAWDEEKYNSGEGGWVLVAK